MRAAVVRWVLAVVILAIVATPALRATRQPAEPPILILVSLDGFRWDYLDRFRPPALLKLAASGVRAKGLIPQFPSKTFPNHYTIVTGLRPAHHGIISNNMVAPDIPGRFTMDNRAVIADPRWWGGEPIWNTVERQGRVAGAMFWPGSETAIGGRQATYWTPFDDKMPNSERVRRVLAWLALPEGKRPSFLTLYMSDVDSAGHSRGPDSAEVREAVARVDAAVAQLVEGVQAAGLADRVNYIVASDHGMAQLSPNRMIVLDDYVNPATVDVLDWAPVLALSPRDGNVEALYAALKGKHRALAVYKSAEVPAKYGLAGHPRLPPVIGIANEGWFVTSRKEMAQWGTEGRHAPGGTHGYDPRFKSMQGIFIGAGPSFKRGKTVPPFQNIHVYDLMCAVLGLQPAPNDGDARVTRPMLR
jgi:predicted AlkP superfamily pyrophosphatase or phosphodiesterase